MPSVEPITSSAPEILYRVGRHPDVLRFASIDPLVADQDDVGNRFDVVGGGVLYAATTAVGAYKETIAFARAAASSGVYSSVTGEHFMNPGNLPADWRDKRRLARFQLVDAPPFLDLESDQTLSYLTEAMSETLSGLGVETLDQGRVRGPNRLLTRAIALFAYTSVDEYDEAKYSGVRYSSKFQSHECWAIFQGVTIGDQTFSVIEKNDTELAAAARALNVKVH